ncbi:MAG: hypothetical protein COA95_04050 [Methylophaga sp.]|nr:MAG: hypothetical protein COA95_04050 [Methylophaga sp.]
MAMQHYVMQVRVRTLIVAVITLSFTSALYAADFIITNDGIPVTAQQPLGDNETGIIEVGGQLNTGAVTAIDANGDNITVNNAGDISTTGNFAYGINSQDSNVNISNSGSISTAGVFSRGIWSQGTNATLNNSASITTLGNSAAGIYFQEADATISNSGSVLTAGSNAYGIYSFGTDATISNSGSVSTAGNFAYGIFVEDVKATLSNSGSVLTTGNNSSGIYSPGDKVTLSNSGSISTAGTDSYGIWSQGADATISNSGTISTIADDSYGIHSTNINAIINNSGTLSTTGDRAIGIWVSSDNATINNSGTISTVGQNSLGIFSSDEKAIINNNGIISTTGLDGRGIASRGTNAIINNSGTISTTGTDAHALEAVGNNAVVNNRGLISATGAGALAISGDSSDSTLNLFSGSQIIGEIDLGDNGGDNDTVNIYAGSQSANLTLINVENINLFGVAGVVSGDTVITVDPTGESTRSVALAGLTSSIHNTVSQRMAHTAPFKPVQVASLTLSPGMLFQERAPVAWAQAFGGNASYDAQSDAMAYGIDHIGFTLGYEWDIDTIRMGVLGGVVHAKTKIDIASFKTQSDSYYVGAYGNFNFDSFKITTSLLGGYATHDNNRVVIDNLNGSEVAKSDMDSFFLSPSITLSSAYTIADRLEFRPSASINYSMEWLDSYREKGTTNSNLKVDDRTLKVLTAKAQIAFAYQFDQQSELEFRVGVTSRNSDDDDTDVTIAGNSFSYANAGDENVSGRFAGLNLRVANQDSLTLTVDVEFGGNSDEDYVNGEISLDYQF